MYQSPLHIIPKSIKLDGSAQQLKRLRKELLLRFDLSGQTTIDIAGRDFDKQSIIQHINALTQQPEFHLKIYQHPNLLAFLERQDLAFFSNSEDWEVLADNKFKNQLQPYFTAAYSKKMKAILAQNVTQPEKELQALLNKDFRLPDSYEAAAYTASVNYLAQWLEAINRNYKGIIGDENSSNFEKVHALTKKLTPYFHPFYLKAFLRLPNHFDKLKYNYAKVAGRLVNLYIHKYKRLDRMGYHTVHLVKNFAAVVYQITGKYENGYKELKQSATARVKPEEEGKLAFRVIAMVVGIFICISLFIRLLSYNAKQENLAKMAFMVGHWQTEMTLFKGKEKAVRFLDLKADGTGQTQIAIIDTTENLNCKLTAKFKWEITGNTIRYNYERNVNYIQTKSSSRTIPIYTNAFSNNCDTLPPIYQKLYSNLTNALSMDKLGTMNRLYFTTGHLKDQFLVDIARMQAGVDTQIFRFEKVDSSYKKAVIIEESSMIPSKDYK